MRIKVIGDREMLVNSMHDGIMEEIVVSKGDVFQTRSEMGDSYVKNYPNDFAETSDGVEVNRSEIVNKPDDSAVDGLREQIKALGKNPVPGNDIEKLTKQLNKIKVINRLNELNQEVDEKATIEKLQEQLDKAELDKANNSNPPQ